MAYNEQQLETLVRQVLERLRTLQRTPSAPVSSSPKAETTLALTTGNGNQLLSSRVIGTRELESLKQETTRVIVSRGTVVTPAARDWLRTKQIELAWATNGSAAMHKQAGGKSPAPISVKPATRQIVLGQATARFEATAMVRQLESRGYAVQRLAQVGMEQVIRELAASAVFDGMPAVLLTDQPWAAVVAANRHTTTRGAWVRDRRETIAALSEMKMNLAIISVTGQSPFGMLNTILPFVDAFC